MGDVVDIKPAPTADDFEFVVDLARYRENLLDEKAIRKKYRLADEVWEKLGDDDELIRAVEKESIRRVRSGQQKRERAQQLAVKVPEMAATIAFDPGQNSRHRLDAGALLDKLSANGPEAAAAGTYFEIVINLGADQDGKPVVEHYRKPLAIDISPNSPDTNDADPDPHGIIAAIAAKKLITESGSGEPV